MSNLSSAVMLPRPGKGTRGTLCKVRVNCFKVEAPHIVAYSYHVNILPKTKDPRPEKVNRAIWRALVASNPFGNLFVAYDGQSIAYSPEELPGKSLTRELEVPDQKGQFTVSLTLTAKVDLSHIYNLQTSQHDIESAQPIQVMNTVIQHSAMLDHESRKSSFFPRNLTGQQSIKLSEDLKGSLEVWRGYSTSLRVGANNLFLNMDIASCVMVKSGSLSSLLVEFLDHQPRPKGASSPSLSSLDGPSRILVDRAFKGAKIQLTVKDLQGRFNKRKFVKLASASNVIKFQDEHKKAWTVATFFKEKYAITLKYPEWPCVFISKTAAWPIELVDVLSGNIFKGRLSGNQTTNQIKFCALNPKERSSAISAGIECIFPTNKESSASAWGFKIAKQPMVINARLLPPPEIHYAALPNGQISKAKFGQNSGAWELQENAKYHRPVSANYVLCIDFVPRLKPEELKKIIDAVTRSCAKRGVDLKNTETKKYKGLQGSPLVQMQQFFQGLKSGLCPNLILAIFPGRNAPEYAYLKTVTDSELGIPSQGFDVVKALKQGTAYYDNISLKINVKLGGINSVLSPTALGCIKDPNIMVLGADVTHPPPGSLKPSVASIVASMDQFKTVYSTFTSIQQHRKEIITDMKTGVQTLLSRYRERNKTLPTKLIMMRDGVSEGQLEQVRREEVNAIRVACQSLRNDYKPQITFLIAGKRHHMSFTPVDKIAQGVKDNVKAGLVLDTDITSPTLFDWYNQSHDSILGTGRSAHYIVLVDESKHTADELQTLCNNICYTYSRCTRSVSYATPAYYADRVCHRAELIMNARLNPNTEGSVVSNSVDKEREANRIYQEATSQHKPIHQRHDLKLYFM